MISWFERHSKVSWFVVVVIAVVIFYLSSLTFEGVNTGSGGSLLAKIYHVCAFFFLAAFLLISLVKGKHKRFSLLAVLLAVLYGVSDEIHQLFVPGRYGSVLDIGYDSVGIVFAFMVYTIVLLKREK